MLVSWLYVMQGFALTQSVILVSLCVCTSRSQTQSFKKGPPKHGANIGTIAGILLTIPCEEWEDWEEEQSQNNTATTWKEFNKFSTENSSPTRTSKRPLRSKHYQQLHCHQIGNKWTPRRTSQAYRHRCSYSRWTWHPGWSLAQQVWSITTRSNTVTAIQATTQELVKNNIKICFFNL